MNKKQLMGIIFCLIFGLYLFLPLKVSAVNVLNICTTNAKATSSTVCQDTNNGRVTSSTKNPITIIIKVAVNIFSVVLGIAAVVVILISSLRMVISGGDPNTINSSRNAILYALIGLFIATLAGVIANVVF